MLLCGGARGTAVQPVLRELALLAAAQGRGDLRGLERVRGRNQSTKRNAMNGSCLLLSLLFLLSFSFSLLCQHAAAHARTRARKYDDDDDDNNNN